MLIVDIVLSVLFWTPIVIFKKSIVFHILGFAFSLPIGIIGTAVSFLLPARFNMGVDKWREANILSKITPILVSCLMIFLTKLIGSSYATLFFDSLLLGFNIRYISKLIREFIRR